MSWWDDLPTPDGEDPYYYHVEGLKDADVDYGGPYATLEPPRIDYPHEEPGEAEYVDALHEALFELTEKQRFVICLSWGIGRQPISHYEIAEAMGISQQAVHRIYTRAMGRLRGLLNPTE